MDVLQDVAGPSSPVLFLKMGASEWAPVGEENLFAVVKGKNSTAAIAICDGEGNAKAISAWVPTSQADAVARSLESKGFSRFESEVRLPI